MKRPLRPEEIRLWSAGAATVRPAHGRSAPEVPSEPEPVRKAAAPPARAPARVKAPTTAPPVAPPPSSIEPNRHRRIARETLELRLDLHGLDQDQARAALHGFIARAQEDGVRAVLVITGKGVRGDGVLRRRAPEWLAEPPSRGRVAGISPAERQHGGDGAFYVALTRPGVRG